MAGGACVRSKARPPRPVPTAGWARDQGAGCRFVLAPRPCGSERSGAAVTTFDRLASRVFDLYERQQYRQALDLLDREGDGHPEQAWHIGYWRVCLLTRLGDGEAALTHLEQLLDQGLWIPLTWLRNDPDLAGLRGHPRFERAVVVCEQRQREAQRAVTPRRVVLLPEGTTPCPGENGPRQGSESAPPGWNSVPVLIALHGNGENAARAAGCWRFVASRGWALLVPQSTQVMGPDAYHWDDLDRGAHDVVYHYRSMLGDAAAPRASLAPTRVVLAGFSRGAALALHLALSGVLPARGVIALAPHLRDWSYMEELLGPSPRNPGLRAYLLAGSRDEPAVRMSEDVARWMEKAGLTVQVEVVEGAGHFYPPDLEARITPLLAAWR